MLPTTLLQSEPWKAFVQLAEQSQALGERSLTFYNPCVGAWFDCCNNTGLSHRQSNLACGVSVALLAKRTLLVEEHTQARKHTRCAQTLNLEWAALYDLDAIKAELGVSIRVQAEGFMGRLRLPFRPRQLLTPPQASNAAGALVEVVDSVPRAVDSRATLVVMVQGEQRTLLDHSLTLLWKMHAARWSL